MTEKSALRLSIISGMIFVFCMSGLPYGCKQQPQDKRTFEGVRAPVTIGVAFQVMSLPLFVAAEKGYFADEGLDVTIKEYSFGKLCLEGMLAGEVDLATVAQLPIVMNSFKRDDFAIAATFVYNDDESKIVARKDKGITTGSDLKGKKIGVPFGTSSHFFLHMYLNYHKVDGSSVTAMNISAKDLPEAMKSGNVDAVALFEPYAHETMRLLPDKAIRLPKIELFRESFNLVVMKRFAKDHSETLKRVLRAIDKAVAFIQLNRKESITLLAKKLRVDIDFLEAAWDGYVFRLVLDQSLLITMEDQARWAVKKKLTDKTQVPNYLDFVSSDALMAVRPEAVTIIR